jgi:hypothetical protein
VEKKKVESGKKRPGFGPNAEPTPDGQEALFKPRRLKSHKFAEVSM